MEKTYNQQQDSIAVMQTEITKMQPIIEKTKNENNELKEKIKRANFAMKRARDNLRKEENVPLDSKYPSSLYEMNVEMSLQKQKIKNTLIELTKLSDGNREIETKLSLGLSQIGLQMQHSVRPPSSSISPPGSRHSQRSGASFRSGASSNQPTSARRNYNNNMSSAKNLPSQPNSARRSNASNYSKGSASSRKSTASNASKGSKVSVNVHQIEFPM